MQYIRLGLLGLLFSLNLKAETLKLTTYNTGLAHTFVAYAPERLPQIAQALKQQSADVLCLQEVWRPTDRAIIRESLKERYPYVEATIAAQRWSEKGNPCSVQELFGKGAIGRCLLKKCRKKKGDDLTSCVLNDCRESIQKLKKNNQECGQAFFAQAGNSMLKALWGLLTPFNKVGLLAYEGESGLALFSKYPLKNVDIIEMQAHSTATRRAAIYAQIDVNGKARHLLCTHLTAELSGAIPYLGRYASWADESQAQAKMLVDYMQTKAPNAPQYLLGDFNCGYNFPDQDIQAEAEPTCQVFAQQGYSDRIGEKTPECTFCTQNTLIDSDKNTLIDHIFTKNVETNRLKTLVTLKQLIGIQDSDGKQLKTNLSDHFGVQMSVSE